MPATSETFIATFLSVERSPWTKNNSPESFARGDVLPRLRGKRRHEDKKKKKTDSKKSTTKEILCLEIGTTPAADETIRFEPL